MNKDKSNRKGQIELSANFIVVIVISIIILVGGLALFFKMKNNAQSVVDTLDSQTQDRIKSMMLSGNEPVAVYPGDFVIGPGGSQLIGVGVTNNYDTEQTFIVDVTSVRAYPKTNPDGDNPISDSNTLNKYRDITSTNLKLSPHSQGVKGILIRMPTNVKGQYVYTIVIKNDTRTQYGVVQAYANNQ